MAAEANYRATRPIEAIDRRLERIEAAICDLFSMMIEEES